MATITQAGQPFRIGTPLGPDELLLDRFWGSEKISEPFLFAVDLVSENGAIAAPSLLRQDVILEFDLPNGSTRTIHGKVRRFAQLHQRDQLTYYRAEVVPWLWFLSLSTNVRIFQNLDVLEIVQKVFKDSGYSDFENKCTRSYPKREYCVQYRETDLNFISRLLEDEGIYYFFKHSAAKHVLVLADDNSSFAQIAGGRPGRLHEQPLDDDDVVLQLTDEHAVFVGKVTLTDYDYLQPSLPLLQTVSGKGREELYDYPGMYSTLTEGDRLAAIRLQEREAQARILTGAGTMRAFQAGQTFDLADHYRRDINGSYILTAVQHAGHAGAYRAWDDRLPHYDNKFTAIPAAVPFRPPRVTPRPSVRGSQPALVVGPTGEEIWVDKHGRVKVQFYWDREGKKDENSSCWVRVSTSWAGKGWGFIQIPRIGQEVIVDFMEGDPDRPIVTGRVYNAEQAPPYDLPANQTQSGGKSRSSKGGGTDNFNEIRFEDLKGSEQIYVHAEKDRVVVVEHDNTESVGNDEKITISGNQTIDVAKDRTETVDKNESITIKGLRKEEVAGNETIRIGGDRNEAVKGSETIKVDGKRTTTIEKDETLAVSGNRAADISKSDSISVGKKFSLDAADEIVLKTGSASIVLKKDGTITLNGKDITLKGSGKIVIQASGDMTLKGSQIKQN